MNLSTPQWKNFGIATLVALLNLPRIFAADTTPTPTTENEVRPVEDASIFKLQTKANPALPTIYIVGDSTVKVGDPGQRGWGDEIAVFFDLSKVNVVNQAIGGRSSRTYQAEGRWDAALAMVKPGDFVIFQFGHNDGGAINDNFRARASISGTSDETQEIDNILTKKHEIVHTFGWYMRKYAADTKAKGATPIICSLIPRQKWVDGKVARASDGFGGWARTAAQQEATPFVDLNEIIAEQYEKLGQPAVVPLFASGPHTTIAGAQLNARCVVSGLKALPGTPIDQFLSAEGKAVSPFSEISKTK